MGYKTTPPINTSYDMAFVAGLDSHDGSIGGMIWLWSHIECLACHPMNLLWSTQKKLYLEWTRFQIHLCEAQIDDDHSP
jgi:hypothetical protein